MPVIASCLTDRVSSIWYAMGVLPLLVAVAIRLIYAKKAPRVPDGIPILKLSHLPGKAGIAADIKQYAFNSAEVIQKGYDMYSSKGQNYLLRTPEGLVFIAAPRFIDEIKIAPDSGLDPMPNNKRIMQVRYTLHPVLVHSWYEFEVVRRQLTQSLGPALKDIVHECNKAFAAEIGEPKEFTSLHIWPAACRIVTRTANRIFFGEDIAGNDEFLRLSTSYTTVVFGGAALVRQYPEFLRHLVMRFGTDVTAQKAIARRNLEPLLDERIAALQKARATGTMEEFDREKPSTLIQWLLDVTPPDALADKDLLLARLLHLMVAAVHTSATSFLETVHELVLHPEIHEELQGEILSVFGEFGSWSKQALSKMIKIDSFMRECARLHPFLAGALEREAMRDFALSDGSVISKGMKVSVPQYSMAYDETIYGKTAHEFDAFRFSKKRAEPGQELNHSFVQTGSNYIHFGHGKHACPGRFFASNEIKVLLVYLISRYEVRWPKDQAKPKAGWLYGFRQADQSLNLELKLREQPIVPIEKLVPF